MPAGGLAHGVDDVHVYPGVTEESDRLRVPRHNGVVKRRLPVCVPGVQVQRDRAVSRRAQACGAGENGDGADLVLVGGHVGRGAALVVRGSRV